MSVRLIAVQDGEEQKITSKRHFFIGLYADSRPTIASHTGLPTPTPGSQYYCYDTMTAEITYDGTNWVSYPIGSSGGGGEMSRFFVSSAATTTTITAAALDDVAGEYVGQMVLPLQGAMAGEGRYITAYNGTNQLTVSPAWAADPDAAGNIAFAVVSGAYGLINATLGQPTDTGVKLSDSASSAMAYLKGLIDNTLVYEAPITTAADTTSFACSQLIGFGNGYFKNWYAYVVWDAGGGGAAPQGEMSLISAYVSATGTFTFAAYTAAHAVTDKVLIIHPAIANTILMKSRELCTPTPFWSTVQLGLTIPAFGAAGTLTLPSVTIASLPAGATVVYARPFMISRVIKNLGAATNKLYGATVAATSQVIQIKKDSGAWVDAITFIDDQFSQDGYAIEGGALILDATNMATVISGNGVYTFQWLLAAADIASIYFQGVKMAIQLSYSA